MPEPIEIPPYEQVGIDADGRQVIVYHDGDEESHVRFDRDEINGGTWVRFGPTSGDWQLKLPEAVPSAPQP